VIARLEAGEVNGSKNTRSPQFRHPQFTSVPSNCVEHKTQFGVDSLTTWRLGRRNWVGAGAGATPVFVALIRHVTSLVRRVSLVGRSRPAPPIQQANRGAFRFSILVTSKEQTAWHPLFQNN
jgi:hypothetical protein